MTKNPKNARTSSSRARQPGKTREGKTKPTAGLGSQATTPAPVAKAPSKQQHLVSLLLRDEGATLDQMIAVTGWLPHTTRAALTGLKKKGYAIGSDKVEGVRTYRGIAPE